MIRLCLRRLRACLTLMVMTRAPHHLPPEIFPKFLAGRRTMEHQIFGALITQHSHNNHSDDEDTQFRVVLFINYY
jgi:hypothetical protein